MDPLRSAAARDPEAPALEGRTYAELDRWADRIALRLQALGAGPGSLVAAAVAPSPAAIALVHAVPRAGGVLLPLGPTWTQEERARALEAAGRPGLLVVDDPDVAAGAGAAAAGDEVLDGRPDAVPLAAVAGEDTIDETAAGESSAVPPPDFDTPWAVMLTSGTTGRARPVPITHGNLAASARGAVERLRLDSADRWLTTLSLAHIGGLALVHRAAWTGCALVVRPRFDPSDVADLLLAGRISHASLVPTMLVDLLDVLQARAAESGAPVRPPALRCLLIGGARTSGGIVDRALRARLPVALTYGLTEATSQVATAPPEAVREKPGSVGKPLPGVHLRIRRPDGEGVGEIQVRGPTVAPLLPAPTGAVRIGSDGWLRTGDLGRVDPDGDLFVVGRSSDRIITGGVNVDPAEVEEALARHPHVAEVAVIGLPDPRWGERVVAVVVPAPDGPPPTTQELLHFSRPVLSAPRRPRQVIVVDALPRGPGGKLDRAEVARRVVA